LRLAATWGNQRLLHKAAFDHAKSEC